MRKELQYPFHDGLPSNLLTLIDKLDLSEYDRKLLQDGEDKPLEYVIADRQNAEDYAQLLLRVFLLSFDQADFTSHEKSARSLVPDADTYFNSDTYYISTAVSKRELCRYALGKLSDVIISLKLRPKSAKTSIASTFFPNGILIDSCQKLSDLLQTNAGDSFTQTHISYCLILIALEGCKLATQNMLFSSVSGILKSIVSWIASKLQSGSPGSLSVTLPTLKELVLSSEARGYFTDTGGLGCLSRHLKQQVSSFSVVSFAASHSADNLARADYRLPSSNVQQQYDLAYCLWIMSLNCKTETSVCSAFHRDCVVGDLAQIVSVAKREKVTRLILATLRNLADCNESDFGNIMKSTRRSNMSDFTQEMVGSGMMKSIALIEERPWKDPELLEDLDVISERLREAYKLMTTWEVYKAEVESGYLHWGVVHKSDFFRKYWKRFEGADGKFILLQKLIILSQSLDDEVAAIACFDLGEFARHYPNGKSLARRIGARDAMMKLVSHDNNDVQHQALISISKMLINNFEGIQMKTVNPILL